MNPPSRRDVLTGLGLTGAALLVTDSARAAGGSAAQTPAAQAELAPAHAGKHEIVPLPFDPKSLRGISEKLIVSHHDNNYAGAVKNLDKVEAALAVVTKDTPAFVVSGLKERELTFANSVTLHELYFANLGGDGKPNAAVTKALGETYGSMAGWEEEFRATAASLGGGSGWTIVDYELGSRTLRTHWSGNHTQSKAGSLPLLVLDMYEHAYQMDYGAAAAKYIDAFFQNVNWDEVQRRFEAAVRAAEALHK
jgi:Fe-Mn family superoxide dismutase